MGQSTKKMLAYALVELLKTKPLNKITIADITSKCEINRMTFYYHFKDIYDLIAWVFVEKKFVELELNEQGIDWRATIRKFMDNVRRDELIISNVYNSISHEYLEKYLNHVFKNMFMQLIEQSAASAEISEDDKDFIAKFYNRAFCGFILEWIGGGMKNWSDAEIDRLGKMLDGNLEYSINNLKKN
jgi:AcrR family transcriptional regulator